MITSNKTTTIVEKTTSQPPISNKTLRFSTNNSIYNIVSTPKSKLHTPIQLKNIASMSDEAIAKYIATLKERQLAIAKLIFPSPNI